MPRDRMRQDGSRPATDWDDDATRAYRRADDAYFAAPRPDSGPSPTANDAQPHPARVIPLLRAQQRPRATHAPVPSLRAHVEERRAAARREQPFEMEPTISGRIHADVGRMVMSRPQIAPRTELAPNDRGFEHMSAAVAPHAPAAGFAPSSYVAMAGPAFAHAAPMGTHADPRLLAQGQYAHPNAAHGPWVTGGQHFATHIHLEPQRSPAPPPERYVRRYALPRPALPPAPPAPRPQYFEPAPAVRLPADEFAAPFRRSAAPRGSRGWIVVLIAAAGAVALYGRELAGMPRSATAIVPVRPLDASVSIDGQDLASQGGLFKIPELSTDRDHVIEVAHKGYVSATRRIRLNPGEVRVLPGIELEVLSGGSPTASAARIPATDPPRPHVAPRPPTYARGATPRRVDGDERGSLARAGRRIRPASKVSRVRVSRERDEPPVPVGDGRPGVLRINSLPWAQVSIDGELVGTTPQRNIQLSPGRHKVKLVNPDLGMSKGFSIEIAPGQTLTKSVSMVDS